MNRALVTGGCGFIGSHACQRLNAEGFEVTAVDNLSRQGSRRKRDELKKVPGISFVELDVRERQPLSELMAERAPDLVIHLAAQVAVTHSVRDPRADFECNALGTFNVLEACRGLLSDPLLIFASTNKVYGSLRDLELVEEPLRWKWRHLEAIDEARALDFHSPYGCSKGAADQYWRDYHRLFGVKTVVARQSCIYGPGQTGEEDQGWVAWFAIAAASEREITVFGDGKQVRDLLHVDDLVSFYLECWSHREQVPGEIFNVGGGAGNSLSILEYLALLDDAGLSPVYGFAPERPGDQKLFISDNHRATAMLGWQPRISASHGVDALIAEHRFGQPLA